MAAQKKDGKVLENNDYIVSFFVYYCYVKEESKSMEQEKRFG